MDHLKILLEHTRHFKVCINKNVLKNLYFHHFSPTVGGTTLQMAKKLTTVKN